MVAVIQKLQEEVLRAREEAERLKAAKAEGKEEGEAEEDKGDEEAGEDDGEQEDEDGQPAEDEEEEDDDDGEVLYTPPCSTNFLLTLYPDTGGAS